MTGFLNDTPEQEAAFLDALRGGRSVSAACLDAGLERAAVDRRRTEDARFRHAWDEAVEAGTDRLEDEAYRRAVHGKAKPVYHGGKQVGSVQEPSDALMALMLKARRPQKFKDRGAMEVTGKDGRPIETEDVSARDILSRRIAGLAARTGADGGDPEPH